MNRWPPSALDNENIRKEFEELKLITDERFQIVFETLDQLISIENTEKKKSASRLKKSKKPMANPCRKLARLNFH
jgi:uncharacterized tellurite resistance protein B-like protein